VTVPFPLNNVLLYEQKDYALGLLVTVRPLMRVYGWLGIVRVNANWPNFMPTCVQHHQRHIACIHPPRKVRGTARWCGGRCTICSVTVMSVKLLPLWTCRAVSAEERTGTHAPRTCSPRTAVEW
jgi:hypothetical protein